MRTLLRAAAAVCAAVMGGAAWGQQTITYQGQLKSGTSAASGLYDMRFSVMNASSGGSQLDQVCVDNVQVTGGLFTVQLPFTQTTAALLAGNSLFLAIEVRPDAGQACGAGAGYSALSPRQALTATPKAQVADVALNFAGGTPVYAELKLATPTAVPLTGGLTSGLDVAYDTVIGNTGGSAMFNPAQPTRIGAPQTGRYLVNVRLGAASGPNGVSYAARLRKNGDTNLNNEVVMGTGGENLAQASTTGGFRPDEFTTVVSLTQGDFIEVWVSAHRASDGLVAVGQLSEATVNVQLLSVGPQGPMGLQGPAGAPGPAYVAGSGLSLSGTTFSIPAGGVSGSQIAPGAVSGTQLAAGAVGTSQLGSGVVGSAQLAFDGASLTRVSGGVVSSTVDGVGVGTTALGAVLAVGGGSPSVRVLDVQGAPGSSVRLAAGSGGTGLSAGGMVLLAGNGGVSTTGFGNSGATLTMFSGAGGTGPSGNANGGAVSIRTGGGSGDSTQSAPGGDAGTMLLQGGNGGGSSTAAGNGGSITIASGNGGFGAGGNGGNIAVVAGNSFGTGEQGHATISALYTRVNGPLGVGGDPARALHVREGASGATPSVSAHAVVEDDGTAYLALLTPDVNEKGINFGSPASAVHGGIYYTNASGMSLRTGGNNTALAIDAAGNVGIGGSTAGANLRVSGTSPVKFVLSPTVADTNTEMMFSENTSLSNGIKLQMDGSTNALSVTDVTGGAESNIATFDRDGNTFSAGAKAFRIDHPLDPLNKELWHSCVESPDMLNIYSGVATTGADGLATVELPSYFEALNGDFRYQLTVIDEADEPEVFLWAKVVKKVAGNRFTIRTSRPGVEVSWQVTGVRKDALARTHRIVVERDKPDAKKGTYLHPEAFEGKGGAK
jgi:hypothetical protein